MSLPPSNVPLTSTLPQSYLHPEYVYWTREWQLIRDCIEGEVAVKRRGTGYLSRLESMSDSEYQAFLDRAVFFNMVSRTITGLVGKLFRRPPVTNGIPERLVPALDSISRENESLDNFVKGTAKEVFSVGRYGVLVDMDPAGANKPYLAGYTAENIIDWQQGDVNGRTVTTKVVLREYRLAGPAGSTPTPSGSVPVRRRTVSSPAEQVVEGSKRYRISYRVLVLEDGDDGAPVYRQYVYFDPTGDANFDSTPPEVVTPTNRGVPFREIPFVFFGSMTNLPAVEKSPVHDIARLNVSHYGSYALLEHGRFYTALPVYYAPVRPGQDAPEFTIGPATVWLVGEGQKPGLLEFNGQGLKFLENALSSKEAQIAVLGGRLMGVTQESTAESDNVAKLKEANEHALLLNLAGTLDVGFTRLLRWWAGWQDIAPAVLATLSYEVSKSFIFDQMAAREFRAIHAMYLDGVIPIQVVYDYLKRAEVIPDWLDEDQFTELLDDAGAGFPGQIDAEARGRGYQNRAAEIADENDADENETKITVAEIMSKGNIEGRKVQADAQLQATKVTTTSSERVARQNRAAAAKAKPTTPAAKKTPTRKA